MTLEVPQSSNRSALRWAGVFACLALAMTGLELLFLTAWERLYHPPDAHVVFSTLAVVSATAALIFLLLRRGLAQRDLAIQELRDARATLARQHALVSQIMDASPVGIVVFNPDGTIAAASRRACEIAGLPSAAFLQRRVDTPEWRLADRSGAPLTEATSPFHRVMATAQPVLDVALRVTRADGVVIPIVAHEAPVFDEAGRIRQVVATLEDVSAREAAAHALRESEARFQKMFRSSPASMFVTRMSDGRFLDCNASFERLTGYTREETRQRTALAMDMWSSAEERATTLGALRAEGRSVERRHQLRCKSGAMKDVVAAAEAVELAGETCVLVSMVDITERCRAEEALRQSESRYRTLIETAREGVWVLDRDLRTTLVNRQMAALLGYTAEEMQGRLLTGFAFDEDHATFCNTIALSLNGQSEVSERRLRRKDGTALWALLSATPVRDAAGAFTGVFALVSDITERKWAESALRESEQRYRALFEQAADAIAVFDPETLAIVDFNDEAWRRLGYTCEEFAALRITDLDVLASADATRRQYAATIQAGASVFETKHRTKDGAILNIEVRAKPIRVGGRLLMQGMWRDITARQRAEAELRDSRERLQALVRYTTNVRETERTTIAREIHDDLGQVLSAMRLDLVGLRQLASATPRAPEACRAKIADLLGLVDGALRSVRALSAALRPGVLDDLGLKAALAWHCGEMEKRSQIAWDLDIEPDLPEPDSATATALFRVLQEATTNIVRHAGAEHVAVNLRAEDGGLALRVADDGCGITPEQAADPRSFGIMGMRERIRDAGGRIDIGGTDGRGTTVRVWVPAGGKTT